MTRLFVDSSVLFAAAYSARGHARDLILMAIREVEPTSRQVRAAAKQVALKDAPLIAAGRRAKVDQFVTYDKKHLLGRSELAKYVRADIMTPKEVIASLTIRR